MIPDWQTLFSSRPLVARAMRLPPSGLASPLWFASASSADLMELPADLFLTTAEITRASAFKFGQPRENFTLGRLAGKLALAAAVGANRPLIPAPSLAGGEGGDFKQRLRSFEIMNGEQGQPVVLAPAESGFNVSLSHVNGSGVAVAFPSGFALGLDLELIDARRAETVRKGVPLSAEEEVWLKTTSMPEATALLLLWTARESLGKALGCGLACKWESLALGEVTARGAGLFTGSFLHSPRFRCVNWVGPDAVMSVAFAPA
ncbi:MAG: 4'-phosphopantetheinyl transferase superfamily protein [Limisphaerales bacterium]